MASQSDAVTVALTGQIPLVMFAAVPVALVLSTILLWIYLRAVRRSMMRHSGAATAVADEPIESAPVSSLPPLGFREGGTDRDPLRPRGKEVSAVTSARWRAAAVYGVAALAYSVAMTGIYLGAKGMEFFPLRVSFIALAFAWPIIMTIGVVTTIARREWLIALAIYTLAMAAIVTLSLNNPANVDLRWYHAILYFAVANGEPTVMVAGLLLRRMRAVGPMVLALTTAMVAGALTANYNLFSGNPERLYWVVDIGTRLGLDGAQIFLAVALLGAVVMGALGWLLMLWIGALYRKQWISDQSMIVDSVWFIFTIWHAIQAVFDGVWWFAAPFNAFLVYKLVAVAGFAVLRRSLPATTPPPRLLLLRVFSLGRRSGRLFNSLSKLWRYTGTIHMIAGPDLATATVEPHEFLEFLTGRLTRRFVSGAASLERRLGEADTPRDYDGRYRVADFFCHDDTWRTVLTRLASISDAILMDLRGFGSRHQGCVFEIQELLNAVPLDRVVFAIDKTTDEKFLRETFAAAWSQVRAGSPNLHAPPSVNLFRFSGRGHSGAADLVRDIAAIALSNRGGLATEARGTSPA